MYIFHTYTLFAILHSFLHFSFLSEITIFLSEELPLLFIFMYISCQKMKSCVFVWLKMSLFCPHFWMIRNFRLLPIFFQHLEDFPLFSSVFHVSKIHCHLIVLLKVMYVLHPWLLIWFSVISFQQFCYNLPRDGFLWIHPIGNSQSFLFPVIIYFASRISLSLFHIFWSPGDILHLLIFSISFFVLLHTYQSCCFFSMWVTSDSGSVVCLSLLVFDHLILSPVIPGNFSLNSGYCIFKNCRAYGWYL